MLEMLYASGLRVSELVKARLEHLDLEGGFIRVTENGNKTRLVLVGGTAPEQGFLLAATRLSFKTPRSAPIPSISQSQSLFP